MGAHSRSDVSDLDALLDKTPDELAKLYRNGWVPRIDSIRGDLRGRMLAAPIVSPRVRKVLRAFAGTSAFPWRGKSFRAHGIDRGEGINRVFSDRLKLFRFETFIERSRAGDFDAVQLDYDLRGNPGVIRRVKDEIRAIRDGLYLGQAYFVASGKPHLVLYFGLEG
jgi:hypothetical protein